jgi:hypothetical protein
VFAEVAVSLALAGGGDDAAAARRAYRGFFRLSETRPRLACDRYLTPNARRQRGDACDQERLLVEGEPWRARIRLHRSDGVASGYHTVIIDHPMCTSHSPGTVPQSVDHLLLTKRGWKIARFAVVYPRCVPR